MLQSSAMNHVGLVRDPLYFLHSNGPGHPESPDRLRAIDRMLESFPLRDFLVPLPARDATTEELAWVHTDAYIRQIERTRGHAYTSLDADTSTSEHSLAAAVRAAGGVISAVEAVISGKTAGAFALVRPPGHHAEAGQAMGFCLFNNVAVASEFALRRCGADRVLVVDWDVHHGNGTMHSFSDTDKVLYFSVHQYPHYPGTGRIEETGTGRGLGYTVNVPLPPGQGDDDYAAVFDSVLTPIALRYRPQLILVSAGFDIHRGDPLADMQVTTAGFARLTNILLAISAACCPGRLAFALEGGYDLAGLAEGVSAVLETLVLGGTAKAAPATVGHGEPSLETRAAIVEVLSTLRPFWKSP
jgi:acetoin utilization deacetylase AcuC-like enzyme